MKSLISRALAKYDDLPVTAKAALWFTVAGIVHKSMSMITMPIFTRMLTTEQYGLYSLYMSWLQVFTILTTLRVTYAVFNKGMSKYPRDRDAFTATMQSLTTLLTLGLFLVYLLVHEWVDAFTGLTMFLTVAMFLELLLSPAIDLWSARERYRYRYQPIVIVAVLMTVANAAIGVVAVLLSEDGGAARILSHVAVQVAVGIYFYLRNLSRGQRPLVREYAKYAVLFNLPLIPHYLSMYALDQMDRIMVARMIGLSAAALYAVAYNIALVIKMVTNSLTSAITPWLYGRLEKEDFGTIEHRMYPILAFAGVLALAFAAVAPEMVAVLGGAKYVEAIHVIPPVAVSVVFLFAYSLFANVQFFYEANKFIMYVSVMGALLNFGLNYVLIERYGYLAAAYTTLLCYALFAVAHYWYMAHVVRRNAGGGSLFGGGALAAGGAALLAAMAVVILTYGYPMARYAALLAGVGVAVLKREQVKAIFAGLKR